MLEFFKTLFKDKDIPDDQLQKFAAEFSVIALATLMKEGQSVLSEDDSKKIAELVDEQKFEEALAILKGKYKSDEEWNSFAGSALAPLVESYVQEVVLAK